MTKEALNYLEQYIEDLENRVSRLLAEIRDLAESMAPKQPIPPPPREEWDTPEWWAHGE